MENWNEIYFELSIGIIAAYIFYVINIQIVASIKERKTRKLIKDYLRDIIQQIGVGQLYLKETYFENKDFDSLTLSDFSDITSLKDSLVNFSYEGENTKGETTIYSLNALTEVQVFSMEMDMVRTNIQEIFSFPYIDTLDYDLINLLHKIKSSLFYIGVKNIEEGITFIRFNEHIFHHYENFKALKKQVPDAVQTTVKGKRK
jgi:hypothetical protein